MVVSKMLETGNKLHFVDANLHGLNKRNFLFLKFFFTFALFKSTFVQPVVTPLLLLHLNFHIHILPVKSNGHFFLHACMHAWYLNSLHHMFLLTPSFFLGSQKKHILISLIPSVSLPFSWLISAISPLTSNSPSHASLPYSLLSSHCIH